MKAKCYYCQKDLTERTIKRHSKNCNVMENVIKDELIENPKTRQQFILSLKDKNNKNTYCVYAGINADLSLKDLDTFIRDIWIQEYEKPSIFYVGGKQVKNLENLFLKDALKTGSTFTYIYDHEALTKLELETVTILEVSENHKDVEIISRNTALENSIINSPRDINGLTDSSLNCEEKYMPIINEPTEKQLPLSYAGTDKEKIVKEDLSQITPYDYNRLAEIVFTGNGEAEKEELLKVYSSDKNQSEASLTLLGKSCFNSLKRMFTGSVYSFELKELLESQTNGYLKNLSEEFELSLAAHSTKKDYTDALYAAYEASVKKELLKLGQVRWDKLKSLIKNRGIVKKLQGDIAVWTFFMKKGIVFPAVNDGQYVFVMPYEVQNVFKKLDKDFKIKSVIKNNTDILKLFRGAIKAYGILSFKESASIVKEYYKNMSEEEILSVLKDSSSYYFKEYKPVQTTLVSENNDALETNFFASVNLNEDDYENILASKNKTKTYTKMTKELLASMAKENYWSKSRIGKKFIMDTKTAINLNAEYAQILADSLAVQIQHYDLKSVIDRNFAPIKGKIPERQHYMLQHAVVRYLSEIPLWRYNGATLKEVEK